MHASGPPTWSEWLWLPAPAFLAVVVSAVAAWLAWWQVRVAREKLRHDLFDRRFAIYQTFQDLTFAVGAGAEGNSELFAKATSAAVMASFLLDGELAQALSGHLSLCHEMQFANKASKREGLTKDELIVANERRSRLERELLENFSALPRRFEVYLTLQDFRDKASRTTGSTKAVGRNKTTN